MAKSLIEQSKSNFDATDPTLESINTVCFQRIANATELMANNFLKLQEDNEYLRSRNRKLNEHIDFLTRQSATYKGKFNQLKKIIDNGKKT
jgi:archaellum component FlaC